MDIPRDQSNVVSNQADQWSELYKQFITALTHEKSSQPLVSLCRMAEQHLPDSRIAILRPAKGGSLEVYCAPNMESNQAESLKQLSAEVLRQLQLTMVGSAEGPLWIVDLLHSQGVDSLKLVQELPSAKALWLAPIYESGSGIVGLVSVIRSSSTPPSPHDYHLLDIVTGLLPLEFQFSASSASSEGKDRRLAGFGVMLASISALIAESEDERELLQGICDLAVKHAGLKLAWIGIPNIQNRFEFVAAAGEARGYLDGLLISSDPNLVEGNGPTGQTWRTGQHLYNRSFAETADLTPWKARAEKFGISASATLPIHRQSKIWAVLTVYHAESDVFDIELQAILETLVMTISRGLDRLDLIREDQRIRALNQAIVEGTTAGLVLCFQGQIGQVNRQAVSIVGAPNKEWLLGRSITDFYSEPDRQDQSLTFPPERLSLSKRTAYETRFECPDLQIRWLRLESAPFQHGDFDEIWTLRDITVERLALEQQALLAKAMGSVQEGVIITDPQQQTIYINQAFEDLTGYSYQEMRCENCNLLQGPDTDPKTVANIARSLHEGKSFSGEILNYRKDGTEFWNLLTINPIFNEAGLISHYVGVQRDITTLRSLNTQLEYQAYHDALTGLPNRRALENHLTDAMERADRSGYALAIGVIDLDDFKLVNDRFGHDIGDRLLQELKHRFVGLLYPNEFLARIGSDEFVIVIEELDELDTTNDLLIRINRLHLVLDSPFEPGPDSSINMEWTMGLAVYPADASDGGALVRLADSALYQAKQHKSQRQHWWQLHGMDTDHRLEVEEALLPYGVHARQVLRNVGSDLDAIFKAFIDLFSSDPQREPSLGAILRQLTPEELLQSQEKLRQHFALVFGADTTYPALVNSSRVLGRIFALTGVDSILLLRCQALLRERLNDHLNKRPMVARQRYRLLQVAEHRLQDDIQTQLAILSEIQFCYIEHSMRPMPVWLGVWSDVVANEISALGHLPGIQAAILIRQSSQGVLKIEASAGPTARGIVDIFLQSGIETNDTSILPSNESLMSRAWQTACTQSSPAHALERRGPAWDAFFEALSSHGVRSSAYVPVVNETGHPIAVLSLMGAHQNQFESTWMRQFARSLQQRWREIWFRISQPAPAVSQEQSIAYRQRLFSGGLRMFVQPVIDLYTGECVKVEALARLVFQGRTLGPGLFLPLLGEVEMDRLFRLGLEQALPEVMAWEQQGVAIDIALNLSPKTLMNPECPIWIQEALQRHGFPPRRLTLELLESEEIDPLAKDAAIKSLLDLGIKLAMDDLGSGFSSLQRLASVPFDTIKVDQGLLALIRHEPIKTLSLISSVIQMGIDFGHHVVVEGLEDEGMIEVARILGSRLGQGYGLAKPMAMEDFIQWRSQFRYQKTDGRIETALGALAYHWHSTKHGQEHPKVFGECPLTGFLASIGASGEQALELHQQLHSDHQGSASEEVRSQLQDKLIELVISEVS